MRAALRLPQWVRRQRWMSTSSFLDLSQDEKMIRDSVTVFAQQVVQPKVREMDETGVLDRSILAGLFEQGVSSPCVCPFTSSNQYIVYIVTFY